MSIHELIDGQLERSNQGAVKATAKVSQGPSELTPLPWAAHGYFVVSGEPRKVENGQIYSTVAGMHGTHLSKAVAAQNLGFIVRAVNAHDALVAALTESQRWLTKLAADHDGDHIAQAAMWVHEKHTALLATAERGQP